MRAFLSHSSQDKPFVESVASLLRPGSFELDSDTFDKGELNAAAIRSALSRSTVFCLFLSKHSAASSYVNYEQKLAEELFAAGKIDGFLIFCIDDGAFELVSSQMRKFNIVRKKMTADAIARKIQGIQISTFESQRQASDPFIGREKVLARLEEDVNDPTKEEVKAIFLSGNFGVGRRSLAKKFFQNNFSHVNSVFPTVEVGELDGAAEIYRNTVSELRPTMTGYELAQIISVYKSSDHDKWTDLIVEELHNAQSNDEAIIYFDEGGVFTEAGDVRPVFKRILDLASTRPHPPMIFVSPRTLARRYADGLKGVSFCALDQFERSETKRLFAKLLKDRSISISVDDLNDVIELTDDHPFNIKACVELIQRSSVSLFLADTGEFIAWKSRLGRSYLSKQDFSDLECSVVGILLLLPQLDFDAISRGLGTFEGVPDALRRLIDLHIVFVENELFSISSGIRVSVENDHRFKLDEKNRRAALKILAESLTVRLESGDVGVPLLDAAIAAQIQSENFNPFIELFLLPSHRVKEAIRLYNYRRWIDCYELCQMALKTKSGLSDSGIRTALRYSCLASSRTANASNFQKNVSLIKGLGNDAHNLASYHFLRGFDSRLNGRIEEAYDEFKKSESFGGRDRRTLRELATVSMSLGELEEAEKYARQAYALAPSNPYVLDILASVLIKKLTRHSSVSEELEKILEQLNQFDTDNARPFYPTRVAEMHTRLGDARSAIQTIRPVYRNSGRIPDVVIVYFYAALQNRDASTCKELIRRLGDITFDRKSYDLKSELRTHAKMEIEFLIEFEDLKTAGERVSSSRSLTEQDRRTFRRNIDFAKASKDRR